MRFRVFRTITELVKEWGYAFWYERIAIVLLIALDLIIYYLLIVFFIVLLKAPIMNLLNLL